MSYNFPEQNERTPHIEEQLAQADERQAYDDAMAHMEEEHVFYGVFLNGTPDEFDEPDDDPSYDDGWAEAEAEAYHSQYDYD